MNIILSVLPGLLWRAVLRRNWGLLVLTLDLAVPPLSLLGILVVGMTIIGGLSASIGFSSAILLVSMVNLLAFLIAVFLAWLNCGRDIVPARALLSLPLYMLAKLGLYRRFLSGKGEVTWIRTDRNK